MALKQTTVHTLMLLLMFIPLATAQSLQLVYIGRSGRQPGDNRITLECRRDGFAVASPQIFVERSDLARQAVAIVNNQSGQVTIEITQELEGSYSCSDNGDRSTCGTCRWGNCYQLVYELYEFDNFLNFFFCSIPWSKSLDSFILCLSGRTTGHRQLSCNAWKTEPILQCEVDEWQCDHCHIKPSLCGASMPTPWQLFPHNQ